MHRVRRVELHLTISLWAVLLGLGLVAGLLVAPSAMGQAGQGGDSAGAVTGVAVNGSERNTPVAGLLVTLQAVSAGTAKNASTTHTDSSGQFSFSGLDTSGLTTYAVFSKFHGGLFATPAISFTSSQSAQVTLDVYDTTSSDSALRVVSTTILLSNPNQPKGLIPVGVLMTLDNTGSTAYVASGTTSTNGPPNLMRFWLPPSALNLTLGAGFSGLQVIQVDTGFGANATVPPGESAYAFAYSLPYSGTNYTLLFKAEYPSDQVDVLLPPSLKTAGPDFTVESSVKANGQNYQVVARKNVGAGSEVSLQIRHLPLPGENPDFAFYQLVLLGLGLLLLLLGLSVLFLRRGALAVAFGWVPASLLSPARLQSRQKAQREALRKRLLRALIALDEQRAAGSITEGTYSRQRARIRSELRPLLASDLVRVASATGAARDGQEDLGTKKSSVTDESPALRGGQAS